jgi:hypothetical protein
MRFNGILPGLFLMLAAAGAAPATFKVSEFTFARPEKWEWVESTSPMRAAQLKTPGVEGKDGAEVVFFYFGAGGAGGTQANVDRWLGQFAEPRDQLKPKVESSTVGRTKVTYVEAVGTYQSGMPGGPKTPQPGTLLLGAIIEGGEGSVFVRLTGPEKSGRAATAAFKRMIEGALK